MVNRPTIEEILTSKPDARPRIYAYSIADEAHDGLLKVGQTTRDVKQRIAEQLKTAAIANYTIELDEPGEADDGSIITDHAVRDALKRKGFANPQLEWMRCSLADVKTVLAELRSGQQFTGTHHEDCRRLGSLSAAYHCDKSPNESSSDDIHTGGLAGPEYSRL